MSIIDPLICGFLKVICYNLYTQTKNKSSHTPGNRKHNQSISKTMIHFRKPFLEKLMVLSGNVTNMQSLDKNIPQKKKHLVEVFSTDN